MTAGPVFSNDNTVIMILLLMIMIKMIINDDDDDYNVTGWRHQSQLRICWSEWGISARET